MKTISSKLHIVLFVIICACAAGFVDGVIQPPYFLRAAMKAALFIMIPVAFFHTHGNDWKQLKSLLIPQKRDLFMALLLGAAVYGIILGGYLLFAGFYDISEMVLKLTSDAGVRADNFLWISLYISLVNSLLEEFLFRGIAFLTLKKHASVKFSYIFSASVFALYHFGMMAAGNFWISLLALLVLFIGGCIFNRINERSGTIINSWLVHMCANFAINTIACMIFGII